MSKNKKVYAVGKIPLKNGRKLNVTVTFSDDEERNQEAFTNAVKFILFKDEKKS